jgi:hypothetical protein
MAKKSYIGKSYTGSILKTLSYSAVFRYPLSYPQLSNYLIGDPRKRQNYEMFRKDVSQLIREKKIRVKKGKLVLSGVRTTVDWEARQKTSQQVIVRNAKVFEALESIPWIKLLGVTGSVATYNATTSSDIDLFIIAQKNRVWVTRAFVFLMLKVLGKYPYKGMDAEKFCPNIYLDERALAWKKDRQSIYTAHELMYMQPLVDRGNTYFKFMKANRWVFKYFSNFKINTPKKFSEKYTKGSKVVDLVDEIGMRLQLAYMKKKKTTEVTTKHFIHFNKYDHSKKILSEFEKNWKKVA